MSRKAVAAFTLLGATCTVIFVFWHQELAFARPTPVPANYQSVSPGDTIALPVTLPSDVAYFLHFYNPECPCSRFNARHIQELIQNHHDRIDFIIVVNNLASKSKATKTFGSDLTYLIDESESLAKACGVYSTPQAAIISKDGRLFYRGNYNRARYCTSRATNFAELALLALLNNQSAPLFDLTATQSYGCELKDDSQPIEF